MLPLFLFAISLLSANAIATDLDAPNANQLVDLICNHTSNRTTCVNSLNSDPRTPTADQYTLAFIAVNMAYNYAVDTRLLASQLLTNVTSSDRPIQACVGDYDDAVSKLSMASEDLNSETYFELESLSGKASDAASHCQSEFPALTARNEEFRGLCEIVGAVGKVFTGGD